MTNTELLHEFCGRSPELYMDFVEMASQVGRQGVIRLLAGMDRDRMKGQKGRILRQPWTDEDGSPEIPLTFVHDLS